MAPWLGCEMPWGSDPRPLPMQARGLCRQTLCSRAGSSARAPESPFSMPMPSRRRESVPHRGMEWETAPSSSLSLATPLGFRAGYHAPCGDRARDGRLQHILIGVPIGTRSEGQLAVLVHLIRNLLNVLVGPGDLRILERRATQVVAHPSKYTIC